MTRREWLALTGTACLAGCGKQSTTRVFAPVSDDPANPERGFYVQRAAEDPGELGDLHAQGVSLVLLTLDLKHYRNHALDDAKLSVLDDALQRIRKAGLKVIFRAAYGFTDADYRVDPVDLTLISGHIAAVSKTLTRHAPWIFTVQAGMLGPWGEWHGSNHGDPPSLAARRLVLDSWLEHLPSRVFLQVRRPMFLRDMNADLARVGCHNDALLSMPDDMGTYVEPGWDRKRELEWCGTSLASVPFGGETVPDSKATPPAQVLDELAMLHATYLNQDYHAGTLAGWKQETTGNAPLFDTIRRRLGYRLVPVRLNLDGLHGSLHLRNEGFGTLLSPRRVSFAWMDPARSEVMSETQSDTRDLRSWVPGPKEMELPVTLPPKPPKPHLVPAVRLTDDSDDLQNDARHAIRLIAEGITFDDTRGWNLLG